MQFGDLNSAPDTLSSCKMCAAHEAPCLVLRFCFFGLLEIAYALVSTCFIVPLLFSGNEVQGIS